MDIFVGTINNNTTTQGSYNINILTEVTDEEARKIFAFIGEANRIVREYFGIETSFDIIICRGGWEMEVQVISRARQKGLRQRTPASTMQNYCNTKSVGVTDYRLEEIIIRLDAAKFGHYLHELIHGVISKHYTHQLREALAWYFTLKLTESCKYVRPSYPSWVDQLYIYPINKLAQVVGDDFLRDLAIGSAELETSLLPDDVQGLFLPSHLFYNEHD
jgi:hypothetical protein